MLELHVMVHAIRMILIVLMIKLFALRTSLSAMSHEWSGLSGMSRVSPATIEPGLLVGMAPFCYNILICGLKCLNHWNSTCVNNETICSSFYYWNTNVKLCGEEKICYDNTTHVCFNDSGVVCPL